MAGRHRGDDVVAEFGVSPPDGASVAPTDSVAASSRRHVRDYRNDDRCDDGDVRSGDYERDMLLFERVSMWT